MTLLPANGLRNHFPVVQLVAWLIIMFFPSHLLAQSIYLSTSNRLYRLSLETCTYEEVVELESGSGGLSDITFHPDGTLYGVNLSGELFEIDTLTGVITILHEFNTRMQAMTTSYKGAIYMADDEGDLWTYQKSSGTVVYLGNVGFGYAGDLAFFDGDLYMSSYFEDLIIKINLDNPPNSVIVMENAGSDGGAMYGIVTYALDCNDVKFYGIMSGNKLIYEVDIQAQTLDTACALDRLFNGGATTHEFVASSPVAVADTSIIHPQCGQENGTISLTTVGGTPPYEYFLNSQPFGQVSNFSDLNAGEYLIEVVDSRGCSTAFLITLEEQFVSLIDSVIIENVTCDLNNGTIEIIPFDNAAYLFSIDGINFQESGLFDQLQARTYEIVVQNSAGCIEQSIAEVIDLPFATITNVQVTPSHCGNNNGEIIIEAAQGFDILYSIDSQLFQEENIFSMLPAGNYTAMIMDQNGCTDMMSIEVPDIPLSAPDSIVINHPTCKDHNGSISFSLPGSTQQYTYTLNEGDPQIHGTFHDLGPGIYHWTVNDGSGCAVEGTVQLISEESACDIYIPDIFSPNNDGVNDFFSLSTSSNSIVVTKYLIFDRWGDMAYSAFDFPITQQDYWWNGVSKKISVSPGVYVYFIEIRHENGSLQTFKGNVTLIK